MGRCGGEGAKFWLAVLTEIKNRDTGDVCIVVCNGLKGLPAAITEVWELALVQTCVTHLLRNAFRYASRCCWDEMSRDLRPVCAAANEAAGQQRFDEFVTNWGPRYPAIVRLWRSAWSKFVPFLSYDPDIRRVICSTNAIESLKIPACDPRPRELPNEQAAIKCLHLATQALDPTGTGRAGKARWAARWKPAVNEFAITFEGGVTPGENSTDAPEPDPPEN